MARRMTSGTLVPSFAARNNRSLLSEREAPTPPARPMCLSAGDRRDDVAGPHRRRSPARLDGHVLDQLVVDRRAVARAASYRYNPSCGWSCFAASTILVAAVIASCASAGSRSSPGRCGYSISALRLRIIPNESKGPPN